MRPGPLPSRYAGPGRASTSLRRLTVVRRRRGWPTIMVAVALVVSVLGPLPAGGADGFSDVGSGGTHEPAINALSELGVFADTECGDGLFCPDEPIDRWVMAVWLIRVLGGEVTTSTTSPVRRRGRLRMVVNLRGGTRRPRHNRRVRYRPPPLLPRPARHPRPNGHLLRPRLRPRKRLPGRVHRHRGRHA